MLGAGALMGFGKRSGRGHLSENGQTNFYILFFFILQGGSFLFGFPRLGLCFSIILVVIIIDRAWGG